MFDFERYLRGVMDAAELALLTDVYRTISAEEWFTDDPDRRDEFAKYIISMYRHGMTDPVHLWSLCRAAAEKNFSKKPEE